MKQNINSYFYIIFVLLILSFSHKMLFADSTVNDKMIGVHKEDVRNPNNLIISAGIGNGIFNKNTSHDIKIVYGIRMSYKWGSTFLTAHYLRYDRYDVGITDPINKPDDLYISDMSLMIGHSFYLSRRHTNYIAISGGLGIVERKVSGYQVNKRSCVGGIPFSIEFSQKIFKNFGASVYVFGNYNSLESYMGIVYNVQLWF